MKRILHALALGSGALATAIATGEAPLDLAYLPLTVGVAALALAVAMLAAQPTRKRRPSKAVGLLLCSLLFVIGAAWASTALMGPGSRVGRGLESPLNTAVRRALSLVPGFNDAGDETVTIERRGIAAHAVWIGSGRTHSYVLKYLAFLGALLGAIGLLPWKTIVRLVAGGAIAWFLCALVAAVWLAVDPGVSEGKDMTALVRWDLWIGPLAMATACFVGAVLLSRDCRFSSSSQSGSSVPPWGWARALGVTGGVVAVLVALHGGWAEGVTAGRILVDDSHSSGWERTLPPFTEQQRVVDSPYAFSAGAELLGYTYAVRVHREGAIDSGVLRDVDTLILKTPEKAFLPKEVARIESFVRRGGALLLLGDHTDLLGTNSNLNAVSTRFGIRFRSDSLMSQLGSGTPVWKPRLVPDPRFPDVSQVVFLTGCSLELSGAAEGALCVPGASGDFGDYSSSSHFGNFIREAAEPAGCMPTVAVADIGEGRVVAMSDSTLISCFCIYRAGRDDLLEGLVAFANARGAGLSIARLLLLIGGILLLLRAGARLGHVPLAGLVGLGLLLGTAVSLDLAACPAPKARAPIPRAAIIGERCNATLPATIGISQFPMSLCFDTVGVHCLRTGLYPHWIDSISALDGNTYDVALLFNPYGPWDPPTVSALLRFMDEGGCLITFFEGGDEGRARTDAFMEALHGSPTYNPPWARLKLPDDRVLCHARSIGAGKHVILGPSTLFSREHMGHCFSPVVGERARLMESLFAALGFGRRPRERSIIRDTRDQNRAR